MEQQLEKPARLTKEMVHASLISDVTSKNLYRLLEDGKKIKISKETIVADYELLLSLRDIYDLLAKRLKVEEKPDKDRIAERKAGFEAIMNPIKELLNAKEPELIAINEEILAEERVIVDAIKKQNEIKARHLQFANETTKLIVGAADNKELIRIQKLIGSEKSKTKFYGDYFPIISELCDTLLRLIEERKNIIKENLKLVEEQKNAEAIGDIALATSKKEQIEVNEKVIEQNAGKIAHDAFDKISSVEMVKFDFETESITPRTRRWSYTINDIDLLYQKMPELVEKVPNKKAIGSFIKDKEESGELTEEGLVLSGITLYRKKFYAGINASNQDDAT